MGEVKKNLDIRDDDYVVGIMANLNRPVKRVGVFLKAAKEVLQIIYNVSFTILGDGHLKSELKEMAEQLRISKEGIFLGRRNEIHLIIANWDIGVISSKSEGFSNSILEYMASGIPVVATSVGGNKGIIEDGVNSFFVPQGDYISMAEKICALIKDKNKRLQMAKKQLVIVQQKYAWETKIKEVESYYRRLIDMWS